MYEYRELLPETTSSHSNFVEFAPTKPGRGRVLIEQDRDRSEYLIARIPAEGGHAYRFKKIGGKRTSPADNYDVFVASGIGLHDSCECLGFLRHGRCKHTAALRALLENRWV